MRPARAPIIRTGAGRSGCSAPPRVSRRSVLFRAVGRGGLERELLRLEPRGGDDEERYQVGVAREGLRPRAPAGAPPNVCATPQVSCVLVWLLTQMAPSTPA